MKKGTSNFDIKNFLLLWENSKFVMTSQLSQFAEALADSIRERLLDDIRKRIVAGETISSMARQTDLSPSMLSNLLASKKGRSISLSKILQIWMGLGNPPETLITEFGIEPVLARLICGIMESPEKQKILIKVVHILCLWEECKSLDIEGLNQFTGSIDALNKKVIEFKKTEYPVSELFLCPDAKPKRNKK